MINRPQNTHQISKLTFWTTWVIPTWTIKTNWDALTVSHKSRLTPECMMGAPRRSNYNTFALNLIWLDFIGDDNVLVWWKKLLSIEILQWPMLRLLVWNEHRKYTLATPASAPSPAQLLARSCRQIGYRGLQHGAHPERDHVSIIFLLPLLTNGEIMKNKCKARLEDTRSSFVIVFFNLGQGKILHNLVILRRTTSEKHPVFKKDKSQDKDHRFAIHLQYWRRLC